MSNHRNNGQWTEARFTTFVKSQLRAGCRRWGPKQLAKKQANVERGFYMCAECNDKVPTTLPRDSNGKRIKNIYVDHIKPVVDPATGFTTWDDFIENLYCEVDNLQVLCKQCHDIKSKEERDVATLRRRQEKDLEQKD